MALGSPSRRKLSEAKADGLLNTNPWLLWSKYAIMPLCRCKFKGVGAVLLQDEKPPAHASRALTPTQQRYAQIEKETLAIVYGVQNFHQYIYGWTTDVETDHKPLQYILKQALAWSTTEAAEDDADIAAVRVKGEIRTRIWTLCCWCTKQSILGRD